MKRFRLVSLIVLFVLCLQFPIVSQAASKYVTNCAIDTPQKVGNTTFVAKQYKQGDRYYYKIVMKKNGKSITILKKTTAAFVTNGKDLYYAKQGKKIDEYQYKNTIYKYNIKTKKNTKIVSGTEYTVMGCTGKYLYCGTEQYADGIKLYAFNLKTKKKKYMTNYVGSIFISGNRVITSQNTGAPANLPMYSFKLNGTGKIKIGEGGVLKVQNNRVYYSIVNDRCDKFKIYTCSLTGKNKKAITDWMDTIPSEYCE